MAHVGNPSYSGGKDQEDCSLKPTWAILDPISTNKSLVWWCISVIPAEQEL
jgi:hypothetical protein